VWLEFRRVLFRSQRYANGSRQQIADCDQTQDDGGGYWCPGIVSRLSCGQCRHGKSERWGSEGGADQRASLPKVWLNEGGVDPRTCSAHNRDDVPKGCRQALRSLGENQWG